MLVALCGCNWLVPFIFVGEHKRTVPAEFNKLEGKRALVLVWAEPATLFDYPHIRTEIATYVGDRIRAGVKECEIVDPMDVEDLLQRDFDAVIDPAYTGKHFGVDYVVYIELLGFQIRDPSTPDLVQGKVSASIAVRDINADADQIGRYTLNPVNTVCPEHAPVLMSSRNALLIRRQTYELFSETVARKFYDHDVDL